MADANPKLRYSFMYKIKLAPIGVDTSDQQTQMDILTFGMLHCRRRRNKKINLHTRKRVSFTALCERVVYPQTILMSRTSQP